MVIVWGSYQAGKVDRVGDMFHVVTTFGHLYYVPLLPLGSAIQLENKGAVTQEVPIPLSFKSVLTGWFRAACVVGTLISSIVLPLSFVEANRVRPANQEWLIALIGLLASVGGLILSYRLRFITQASYDRAKQLAGYLELTDVGQLMIEIHYGRMTAEEADRELARRDDARMTTASSG